MKMIGNVSDWLSYAGGALIKVADSAGSTVVEILCGASLGSGISSLIAKSRSHDQDGRHAHIW